MGLDVKMCIVCVALSDDANAAAVGVQVLLVSSLVVLGIFIIVDTLPSLRWVMREMWNEARWI